MSPRAAVWLTISSTPADSWTPRAAVGSSEEQEAPSPERGLADRDDLALAAGHGVDRRVEVREAGRQLGDGVPCRDLHLALAEEAERRQPPRPDELATEEQVGRQVEHLDEGQVLVDGLDTGRQRLGRRGELVPGALEVDLPVTRPQDPGDALHEGRLAGPVVADEADDLAAGQLEAHVLERLDGAVVLADECRDREQTGRPSQLEPARRACRGPAGPGPAPPRAIRIAPRTTSCQNEVIRARVSPLSSTARMRIATIMPGIVPRPPPRLAPPRMIPVIARSSRPWPVVGRDRADLRDRDQRREPDGRARSGGTR